MAAKLIPLKYHVNTNYTIYLPNDGRDAAGIQRNASRQSSTRTRLVRK
jgi:hypothetical protein